MYQPDAIQQYYNLEDAMWKGEPNFKCQDILDIIKDDVETLRYDPKHQWVSQQIQKRTQINHQTSP